MPFGYSPHHGEVLQLPLLCVASIDIHVETLVDLEMSALPRRVLKHRSPQYIASPAATKRYIVIGGGIAGVCCAQELARLNAADQNIEILIITSTEMLKEVFTLYSPTSVKAVHISYIKLNVMLSDNLH